MHILTNFLYTGRLFKSIQFELIEFLLVSWNDYNKLLTNQTKLNKRYEIIYFSENQYILFIQLTLCIHTICK